MARVTNVLCAKLVVLGVLVVVAPAAAQTPLDDEMSYQGLLTQGGTPFTGTATVEFRLFGVDTGGTALATDPLGSQPITDGLLSFCVNFGPGVFDGDERWIEVVIDGTPLSPRQPVCATPYALFALSTPGGISDGHSLDAADGSPVDALFVDNAGFVGIGTSTPERLMHVFGGSAGVVTSNSGAELVVEDDSSAYINLLSPPTLDSGVLFGTSTNPVDGGVLYNAAGDRSMQFRTGGNVNRMMIDSAGNVGIGTSTPERPMHVFGGSAGVVTADSGAELVIEDDASAYINLLSPPTLDSAIVFGTPTNPRDGAVLYNAVGDRSMQFRTGGSSVPRMLINNVGLIGIGTPTPQATLHVRDGSAGAPAPVAGSSAVFERNGSNYLQMFAPAANEAGIMFGDPTDASAAWIIYSNSSDKMSFNANNAERMVIDNAGNVGIGTTAPGAKLHVEGDGFVDGDFTARDSGDLTRIKLDSGTPTTRSELGMFLYDTISGVTQTISLTGGKIFAPSEGAALVLRNTTGSERIRLAADNSPAFEMFGAAGNRMFSMTESSSPFPGKGILTLYDQGVQRIRLGEVDGGKDMVLLNANGTVETLVITGDNSVIGPHIDVKESDGSSSVQVFGGQNGGGFGNAGGRININDTAGASRIVLRNDDGASSGPKIQLFNTADAQTIEIDGREASDNAPAIRLYDATGTQARITLDANDNSGSGRITTGIMEITGADLAEKFPTSDRPEPGMVMQIDPENPGSLRIASGPYNRFVAGVVSGANDFSVGVVLGNKPGQEDAPAIALTGRVYVHADAAYGAIQTGDLLTTSATPGHAMKVTDHDQAQGAILGKAMSKLESGKGLVLVLVSLQ